jgi:hypothetical protein
MTTKTTTTLTDTVQAAAADLRRLEAGIGQTYAELKEPLVRLATQSVERNAKVAELVDLGRREAAAQLAAEPPLPAAQPASMWDTPPSQRPAFRYDKRLPSGYVFDGDVRNIGTANVVDRGGRMYERDDGRLPARLMDVRVAEVLAELGLLPVLPGRPMRPAWLESP